MAHNTLLVLDFGSQYNQLIVRRVRELGVYCELSPPEALEDDLKRLEPAGFILSGGPASVYDAQAPSIPDPILKSKLPVLGICYGMQALARALGGQVQRGTSGEYGSAEVELSVEHPLMKGLPSKGHCWMSHGDHVTAVPEGFIPLARTATLDCAAMGRDNFFGVQFHPEVSHTPFGRDLIRNFLDLCGCDFSWKPAVLIDEAVQAMRHRIGDRRAICAVSGGVDSTVAAVLAKRALGERLHCVFVDNGLLRRNEGEEVSKDLRRLLGESLKCIDGAAAFLEGLRGISDPEEKRKKIGEIFIRLFEGFARDIPGLEFLIQGTLYPDVIESRGSRLASKIKTHHNVGGLPEKLNITIHEPLRLLFKDEVRRLGEALDIPKELLYRQPFPGPGLAVRIMGEVTGERLETLRAADAIVRDEIERHGQEGIWQFFAVYVPQRTVGVMGDQRTYSHLIAIRAVASEDGMTCDWARLPAELLDRMSRRIVNEVPHVNRVVYDITSKPPATIEWE
jgi:GMP synthase (glutamine-hydrolysing)